jgi:hypothetical protein
MEKKKAKEIKQNSKILLIAIPVILALSGIFFIIIFFPSNREDQYKLKIEFVKILVQFFLVSIIGGIFIHEFNRVREKTKNKNEFRKLLLTNMARSYFKVKKVRRILEAIRLKENKSHQNVMPYPTFEMQMKDLIDVQLEFEFLHQQIQIFSTAFENEKRWDELSNDTKDIEQYLNNIIDEYQKSSPTNNLIDTSKMTQLKEFIDNTGIFREKFSELFYRSVDLFQKEILDI